MITLKKLPFTDGIDSVATLLGYDTKANRKYSVNRAVNHC